MMFLQQWVFWSIHPGWGLLTPIAQTLEKSFLMMSWFRWNVIRKWILNDADAVMMFQQQDLMFLQQWVFWSVDAGWGLPPPIAQTLEKWFLMESWFRWDVIRNSILYDVDAVMLFQQQDLMFFQQWVFWSVDAGCVLLQPITQTLEKSFLTESWFRWDAIRNSMLNDADTVMLF